MKLIKIDANTYRVVIRRNTLAEVLCVDSLPEYGVNNILYTFENYSVLKQVRIGHGLHTRIHISAACPSELEKAKNEFMSIYHLWLSHKYMIKTL